MVYLGRSKVTVQCKSQNHGHNVGTAKHSERFNGFEQFIATIVFFYGYGMSYLTVGHHALLLPPESVLAEIKTNKNRESSLGKNYPLVRPRQVINWRFLPYELC